MIRPATKESAIHVARHLVAQEAARPETSMMRRMALNASLASGGIEELLGRLYDMGFVVCGKDEIPFIRQLFETGALIEQK